MKLHLPKGLRTALLACFAAFAGIGTTLSTATITGGVFAVSIASVARATDYTAVLNNDATKLIQCSSDSGVTKVDWTASSITADDTIYINGIAGWLPHQNAAFNAALNLSGGNLDIIDSSGDKTYTFNGNIIGNGNIDIRKGSSTVDSVDNRTYNFNGDLADWAGSLRVENSTLKVNFTNGAEAERTVAMASIYVEGTTKFSGNYAVSSNLTLNNLTVTAGTTKLNGAQSTVANMTIDAQAAAAVGQAGALTLTGTTTLNGNLSNAGTLTLGGTLVLKNTAVVNEGTISLAEGGLIVDLSQATFTEVDGAYRVVLFSGTNADVDMSKASVLLKNGNEGRTITYQNGAYSYTNDAGTQVWDWTENLHDDTDVVTVDAITYATMSGNDTVAGVTVAQNGLLILDGNATLTAPVTIQEGGRFRLMTTRALATSCALSGSGSFEYAVADTQRDNAATLLQNFQGTLTISDGTLYANTTDLGDETARSLGNKETNITGDGQLQLRKFTYGDANSVININNRTGEAVAIQLDESILNGTLNVGVGTAVIKSIWSGSSIAAAIRGEGDLKITGNYGLAMTGGVDLDGGITFSSSGTIDVNSAVTADKGMTVTAGTVNLKHTDLTLGEGLTVSGGSVNTEAALNLTSGIVTTGGTLTVQNNFTTSGDIEVSGGTFQLGSGVGNTSSVSFGSITINAGGTLKAAHSLDSADAGLFLKADGSYQDITLNGGTILAWAMKNAEINAEDGIRMGTLTVSGETNKFTSTWGGGWFVSCLTGEGKIAVSQPTDDRSNYVHFDKIEDFEGEISVSGAKGYVYLREVVQAEDTTTLFKGQTYGAFTKKGAGTLVIDKHTAEGNVTVEEGTLQVTHALTGAVTVNAGAGLTCDALTLQDSDAYVVNGALTTEKLALQGGSLTLGNGGSVIVKAQLDMNYGGTYAGGALNVEDGAGLYYSALAGKVFEIDYSSLADKHLTLAAYVLAGAEGSLDLGITGAQETDLDTLKNQLTVADLEAGMWELSLVDGHVNLALNETARFDTDWDAMWGGELLSAPELPDDGVKLGAETIILKGTDYYSETDKRTCILIDGTTASGGVVIAGGGATANNATGCDDAFDTWVKVTGGDIAYIVGGSYCNNWRGSGPEFNFVGDSHILIEDGAAEGTPVVNYIIGGNYKDGRGPTFVGNSYISLKSDSLKGGLVGGSSKSHNHTTTFDGNSYIYIYAPQTLTVTDGAEKWGDQLTAANSNAIIGGNVMCDNTTPGASYFTGNTNILLDFEGYTEAATMAKLIIGGTYNVPAATTHGTENGGGDTNITIRNAGTTTFSKDVIGGSWARGATVTQYGTANITISSGTFGGKVIGGSYMTGGTSSIKGNTSISVTDGTYSGAVIGGSCLPSGATTATSDIGGDISVSLSGGTYSGMIVGGFYLLPDDNNNNVRKTATHKGKLYLNISGGTYNAMITGHHLSDRQIIATLGDVNMAFSGGTFNADIYGGNYDNSGANYAASYALKDINITVSGKAELNAALYGGSRACHDSATATYTQKNIVLDLQGGALKGNIYAAGRQLYNTKIDTESTTVKIADAVTLGADNTSIVVSGGYYFDNTGADRTDSVVSGTRRLLLTSGSAYTNLANANFRDFDVVDVAANGSATINLAMEERFTKTGAGALVLSRTGADLALAALSVDAGSLEITDKVIANTEDLDLTAGTALNLAGGAELTGDLSVSTQLSLGATSTVSGDVSVVSGGTLNLNGTTTIGTVDAPKTLSSAGALNLNGTTMVTGGMNVTGGTTTVEGNLTVSGTSSVDGYQINIQGTESATSKLLFGKNYATNELEVANIRVGAYGTFELNHAQQGYVASDDSTGAAEPFALANGEFTNFTLDNGTFLTTSMAVSGDKTGIQLGQLNVAGSSSLTNKWAGVLLKFGALTGGNPSAGEIATLTIGPGIGGDTNARSEYVFNTLNNYHGSVVLGTETEKNTALLTLNSANQAKDYAATIAGAMQSTGDFTKSGEGTLRLQGDTTIGSTGTGTLTVDGGLVLFGMDSGTNTLAADKVVVNAGGIFELRHKPDDSTGVVAFKQADGSYTDLTLNGGQFYISAMTDGTTTQTGVQMGTLTVSGTGAQMTGEWGGLAKFQTMTSDGSTDLAFENGTQNVHRYVVDALSNYSGTITIESGSHAPEVTINSASQAEDYSATISGATKSTTDFKKTGAGLVTFGTHTAEAGFAVSEGTVGATTLNVGKELTVTAGELNATTADVTGAVALNGGTTTVTTLTAGSTLDIAADATLNALPEADSGKVTTTGTLTVNGELMTHTLEANGAITLNDGGSLTTQTRMDVNDSLTVNGGSLTATTVDAEGVTVTLKGGSVGMSDLTGAALAMSGGSATIRNLVLSGEAAVTGGSLTIGDATSSVNTDPTEDGGTLDDTTATAKGAVMVTNGTLEADALTVKDTLTVTAGTLTATTADVTGAVALNGGTTTVGTLTTKDTLTVTGGTLTATTADVTGAVALNGGTTTVGALTTENTLTVDGGTTTVTTLTARDAVTVNKGSLTIGDGNKNGEEVRKSSIADLTISGAKDMDGVPMSSVSVADNTELTVTGQLTLNDGNLISLGTTESKLVFDDTARLASGLVDDDNNGTISIQIVDASSASQVQGAENLFGGGTFGDKVDFTDDGVLIYTYTGLTYRDIASPMTWDLSEDTAEFDDGASFTNGDQVTFETGQETTVVLDGRDEDTGTTSLIYSGKLIVENSTKLTVVEAEGYNKGLAAVAMDIAGEVTFNTHVVVDAASTVSGRLAMGNGNVLTLGGVLTLNGELVLQQDAAVLACKTGGGITFGTSAEIEPNYDDIDADGRYHLKLFGEGADLAVVDGLDALKMALNAKNVTYDPTTGHLVVENNSTNYDAAGDVGWYADKLVDATQGETAIEADTWVKFDSGAATAVTLKSELVKAGLVTVAQGTSLTLKPEADTTNALSVLQLQVAGTANLQANVTTSNDVNVSGSLTQANGTTLTVGQDMNVKGTYSLAEDAKLIAGGLSYTGADAPDVNGNDRQQLSGDIVIGDGNGTVEITRKWVTLGSTASANGTGIDSTLQAGKIVVTDGVFGLAVLADTDDHKALGTVLPDGAGYNYADLTLNNGRLNVWSAGAANEAGVQMGVLEVTAAAGAANTSSSITRGWQGRVLFEALTGVAADGADVELNITAENTQVVFSRLENYKGEVKVSSSSSLTLNSAHQELDYAATINGATKSTEDFEMKGEGSVTLGTHTAEKDFAVQGGAVTADKLSVKEALSVVGGRLTVKTSLTATNGAMQVGQSGIVHINEGMTLGGIEASGMNALVYLGDSSADATPLTTGDISLANGAQLWINHEAGTVTRTDGTTANLTLAGGTVHVESLGHADTTALAMDTLTVKDVHSALYNTGLSNVSFSTLTSGDAQQTAGLEISAEDGWDVENSQAIPAEAYTVTIEKMENYNGELTIKEDALGSKVILTRVAQEEGYAATINGGIESDAFSKAGEGALVLDKLTIQSADGGAGTLQVNYEGSLSFLEDVDGDPATADVNVGIVGTDGIGLPVGTADLVIANDSTLLYSNDDDKRIILSHEHFWDAATGYKNTGISFDMLAFTDVTATDGSYDQSRLVDGVDTGIYVGNMAAGDAKTLAACIKDAIAHQFNEKIARDWVSLETSSTGTLALTLAANAMHWVMPGEGGTWSDADTNTPGNGEWKAGNGDSLAGQRVFLGAAGFDAEHSKTTITIEGEVTPSAILVLNDEGTTYTLTGTGSITNPTDAPTTLMKDGNGTLRIETGNSYTGNTTLYNGRLVLAHQTNGVIDALGTSRLEFEGGQLVYDVTGTMDADNIAMGTGVVANIEVTAGNTATWQADARGNTTDLLPSGLELTGAGTFVIENAGTTLVGEAGSSLDVAAESTLVIIGATGGTTNVRADLEGDGRVELNGTATPIALNSADNTGFTGTLTLTGDAANTSTAEIVLGATAGTLASGADGATVELNNAAVSGNITATVINVMAGTTNAAVGDTTYTGDLAGSGTLMLGTDATTLTLDTANAIGFSGKLVNSTGLTASYVFTSATAYVGDDSDNIFGKGAELASDGGSATYSFAYGTDLNMNAKVTGEANLVQNGNATLTLTEDNSSTGTLTVQRGTAQVGAANDVADWAGSFAVNAGATLRFTNALVAAGESQASVGGITVGGTGLVQVQQDLTIASIAAGANAAGTLRMDAATLEVTGDVAGISTMKFTGVPATALTAPVPMVTIGGALTAGALAFDFTDGADTLEAINLARGQEAYTLVKADSITDGIALSFVGAFADGSYYSKGMLYTLSVLDGKEIQIAATDYTDTAWTGASGDWNMGDAADWSDGITDTSDKKVAFLGAGGDEYGNGSVGIDGTVQADAILVDTSLGKDNANNVNTYYFEGDDSQADIVDVNELFVASGAITLDSVSADVAETTTIGSASGTAGTVTVGKDDKSLDTFTKPSQFASNAALTTGELVQYAGSLVNYGLTDVEGSATIVGGSVTNDGWLKAATLTLREAASLTNNGTTVVDGALTVQDSTQNALVNTGSLSFGAGSAMQTVENAEGATLTATAGESSIASLGAATGESTLGRVDVADGAKLNIGSVTADTARELTVGAGSTLAITSLKDGAVVDSLSIGSGATTSIASTGRFTLNGTNYSSEGTLNAAGSAVTLSSATTQGGNLSAASLDLSSATGSSFGSLTTGALTLNGSALSSTPLLTTDSLAAAGSAITLELTGITSAYANGSYTLLSSGNDITGLVQFDENSASYLDLKQLFAEGGSYISLDVVAGDGVWDLVLNVTNDDPRHWNGGSVFDDETPGDNPDRWTVNPTTGKEVLDLSKVTEGTLIADTALDSVDKVIITKDTTIDMARLANVANNSDGLVLNHLEGSSNLTLTGEADDVVTLRNETSKHTIEGAEVVYASTTLEGNLSVSNIQVKVEGTEGNSLTVGDLSMDGTAKLSIAGTGDLSTGDATLKGSSAISIAKGGELSMGNTTLGDAASITAKDGSVLELGETTLNGMESALVAESGASVSIALLNGEFGKVDGTINISGVSGKPGLYSGNYGSSASLVYGNGSSQTLSIGGTSGSENLSVSTAAGASSAELTLDYSTGDAAVKALNLTGTALTLVNKADAQGNVNTLTITGSGSTLTDSTMALHVNAGDIESAAAAGGAAAVISGQLALDGVSITATQADADKKHAAFDVKKGTEGIALFTVGDSATDINVELKGDFFERYFDAESVRVDSNGVVRADLITDHYSQAFDNALSENGQVGVDMLDAAALELNPQDNAGKYKDLAGLLNALDGYAEAGKGAAADTLASAVAGSGVAGIGMALAGDVERQLRAIRNRTTTMGVDPAVVNEDMPYFNAWINAEGDHREMDADGTMAGYEFDSWGGTVGFDVDLEPELTLGVAVTAMYGDITADSTDKVEADVESYYLSAFARVMSSAWVHTFVATVGTHTADINRTVNYGTGSYSTEGEADGTSFGLMYEVARTIALTEDASACWQPVFNIAYRHTELGGYSETGSDAALKLGDQSLDTVTFGLGARVQAVVGENLYNRTSVFEARALAKLDTGDTESEMESSLLNSSAAPGTIRSAERDAFGVELGAGITIPVGIESGSIFLDGSVEFRGTDTNINGTVGYRINF